MCPAGKRSIVETVDSLIIGYITSDRALEIAREYPSVSESLVGWIEEAASQKDWPRVGRLANLAAPLKPPALADVLRRLVDANVSELDYEDLADILGEIGKSDSARSLFGLAKRSLPSDAPAFWLCQKVILSLGGVWD